MSSVPSLCYVDNDLIVHAVMQDYRDTINPWVAIECSPYIIWLDGRFTDSPTLDQVVSNRLVTCLDCLASKT